ncbi:vancomycin B-type resistance protein VanW [Clostridium coskatii]|uniref:Vancomycin B-type resistance protein VanW n=2 Tax=Clostridium coskatii TaxID=1705578 RepID=A0A168R7L9_9CLOT|nr:Vancomycin B-type resistance protein VanW [Clostridium coskatii]OBR91068.1 vancomycin B-type resistance protein VanW [Clostridium coskatii]
MMSGKRKTRKSKRKSGGTLKILGLAALTIFLSISCGFIVYHYNDVKYWDNLIYPRVSINNTDLSEKTKDQAKSIMSSEYLNKFQQKQITITAGNKSYELPYSSLSFTYNLDDTIKLAYSYGKSSNIFKKYELLKNPKNVNYNLKFSYNTKVIDNMVDKIASEVDTEPVNASLEMGGVKFSVIPQKDGVKVDKEALKKDIESKIDNNSDQDLTVKAVLKTTKAKIKEDDLKPVDTLISSFSTAYGGISSGERANNISLATSSINGHVVMPGDTFSFNDVVGQRTAAKGYEAAPVIIGDKVESGLGGGICQVSTTLYNAVAKAGLTSTERTHHTMPVHYVPEGMDATVDYGNIDYKFRNDFKYPIYIQGYTSGGNIVFNLYSNSSVSK